MAATSGLLFGKKIDWKSNNKKNDSGDCLFRLSNQRVYDKPR
jgi:hypothetical protein